MPKGKNTIQTKDVWIENNELHQKYIGLTSSRSVLYRTDKDVDDAIAVLQELQDGTHIKIATAISEKISTEWKKSAK